MLIYGALINASSISLHALDDDGNTLWQKGVADGLSHINGVGIDGNGYIIAVGARIASITAWYYDGNGTELWTYDHGAELEAADANAANQRMVVAGQAGTGGYTTRVLESDGTVHVSIDHGATVNDCAISNTGRIATVGVDGILNVYDADGNLLWTKNHGNDLNAVAFGTDDRVAVAGLDSGVDNIVLRVYDADGNDLWDYAGAAGKHAYGVIIFDDNSVGLAYTGSPKGKVFTAAGSLDWTWTDTNTITKIAAAPAGDHRIAWVGARNRLQVAENGTGTLDWEYDHGNTTNDCAWQPTAIAPPPPAGAGEGVFLLPLSIF